MRKRVKIALVLVFVAAIALAAWRGAREREPVYQGRSLSKWADSPTNGWVWPKAVRATGTNAIPVLLKMLRARETPWARFREMLQKKGILKSKFISPHTRNLCALSGFSLLGPSASNAVPDLLRILRNAESDDIRYSTLASLAEIGPTAGGAVPAISKLRSSTNSQVSGVALVALAAIEGGKHVPELIKATTAPDPQLRAFACVGLACLGTNAAAATADLTRLLRDQSPMIRNMATNALLAVDPVAAYTNGIDTNQTPRL